jgi:Sel1 repeat
MKVSRLILTLLLASSVAVVQLAAQQTKADQKPIEELKAKAEAGDAESEVELGLRYDKGAGVVKDHAEAVKWYRKAAEQNLAKAQYNLGVCYAHGEGVAKDPVEAVKWFRKAAEQNFAVAQYNLGLCYEQGVAKDEREELFPVFWGGTGRGGEVVSQSRRAELRPGSIQFGPLLRAWQRSGGESGGGGEMVSQSRRTELRRRSIQFGHVLRRGRPGDGGLGRGLQVAVAGSDARP